MNLIRSIGQSALALAVPPSGRKTREQWVAMNVTQSELQSSKWQIKPGQEYIARLFGWVATCADKNATFQTSAKIRLFRYGKGKRLSPKSLKSLQMSRSKSKYATEEATEVFSSPGLAILEKPNDFESGIDANYLRHYGRWACGNAFNNWTDDQCFTLRPQFMNVIPSRSGEIIWGWRYGRESVAERDLPRDEVMHFKHRASIHDPFWGYGPTANCYQHADLMRSALKSETDRWNNDGRPPAYASLPKEMTDEQFDLAVKKMRDQVRGVRNTGNWLYGQAVDVKMLGFSPKEMEYLAGQNVSEQMILAAFGIPKAIFYPNDGALAAAQAAMRFYNEITIWPGLCRDADQLTEQHRRVGLIAETEFYAYDAVAQEDEAAESTILKTQTDSGVRTLNEARACLGLDPYPDEFGGDVPRIAGQPVSHAPAIDVAATDAKKPALPGNVDTAATDQVNADTTTVDTSLNGAQVTSLAGLAAQVAANELPLETARAIAHAAFPAIDDATLNEIFNPLKNFEPAKPEPAPVADVPQASKHRASCSCGSCRAGRKDKMPPNPDVAAKMQIEIQRWLAAVTQDIGAGFAELTEAQYAELEKIVYRNMAEAFATAVNIERPTDMPPLAPVDALDAVKQEGALVIEQIAGKTQDDIRQAISIGLEEGKTYADIAKDIQDSGYPAVRAERIARTESANASSMGTLAGMKDAGIKTKKWFLGGAPCAICEYIYAKVAAKGGSIPIDEPFATAGEFPGIDRDIMYPPAHPNCVCDFDSGDTNAD